MNRFSMCSFDTLVLILIYQQLMTSVVIFSIVSRPEYQLLLIIFEKRQNGSIFVTDQYRISRSNFTVWRNTMAIWSSKDMGMLVTLYKNETKFILPQLYDWDNFKQFFMIEFISYQDFYDQKYCRQMFNFNTNW